MQENKNWKLLKSRRLGLEPRHLITITIKIKATMSDSSEFISDISDDSEVEEFLSQANLNASHNDSFGEQKALSPEQIFDQMQSEIEKVCEVTNNVSEC